MEIPIENQRVKEIINFFCDGNELLFSKKINVSQPRINRLFSLDKRNNQYPVVSFDIIQSIINTFIDIDSEWLITGKGEMLKVSEDEKNKGPDSEKYVKLLERNNQYLEQIVTLKDEVSNLKDQIQDLKKRDIQPYPDKMVAEPQQKLEKKAKETAK